MHVLVVEDEPHVARLVKRALKHDLHVVKVANDGAEGLALAKDGQFDALVLDILMPEMDGIEVCRRLRKAKVHTPVLMLTARDAVEQRVQGLYAGADDYLTKPFAVAELQARIRALGRRRGETEDETLEVGDLTLDKGRHEVRLAGEHLDLSKREFMLLEFLMQNKGRVLTRQQILDNVWGYDFDPRTNIVDIYIHYLRKKVDRGKERRLLKTVRGVGYAIEAA